MSDTRQSHGFQLSVYVHTDVGQVRGNNEDSYGYAWLDDGSLFVIVADGMGGHEAGEVASGLAVRVLEDAVARQPADDPRSRLYYGLIEANEAIIEEGKRSGTRGMGTTSVASIFHGSEAHVALIGDSRMYHIRKGQMVWRTLDHTRVQMLIHRGEITEEQGRNHPESGMLTRALGHARMANGKPLVPDVLADPIHLEPEDTVVFSSDGLHDLVDDWEVAKIVAQKTPEEAAMKLVSLANERGGHDNITVAVVVAGERGGEYDPSYVPECGAEPTEEATEEAAPTQEQAGAPLPPSPAVAADSGPPGPSLPPGISVEVLDPPSGMKIEVWMIALGVLLLAFILCICVVLGTVLGVMLTS